MILFLKNEECLLDVNREMQKNPLVLLVAFMHLSNEISTTVITEDAIEGVPSSFVICEGIYPEGGRE